MAVKTRAQHAIRKDSVVNTESAKSPPKALPVTLLSGFLVFRHTDNEQGSGKTTLLQHILRSEHGLRIAVIVNDIGAVNVDASLIRNTHRLTKTEEKVVALQNGCICCTLRGDLLEELVRLAEIAEFDYIIIESSGISEPEQVAETFDSRLAEQISDMGEGPEGLDEATLATLKRLKSAGGLEKFARLDTTCTVIDAFTMFHDFETSDLLSARRDDVVPEDERTVSDLMVDQIEFADVIVLNKTDMVDAKTKQRILDLMKKLNHRAKIVETSYGKVDVKKIVNTGMFNLEAAQTGYGWLQDLHEMTLRQVNGKKTAGGMLTINGGRPWFAVTDRNEWETGNAEIDALVQHDMKAGGLYGDRRQELVFIGEKLDIEGLEKVLDACLLNDEQYAEWEEVMKKGSGPNTTDLEERREKEDELCQVFEDGFFEWVQPGEEEDMEHGHAGHNHSH
ncbi:hypothetical protein D0866_07573 [Hortaea werneckii]|uniref:CobW C-terminal domain-containing protein n=1 Tax=Hortaea werneckii TaxID=91943 RepID=A0A3M7AUB6_HORWE|nr:hypothetical protein D0866_07573 [Hortaea werneckii]